MTADQLPVANAGCFLCGRAGTARMKTSSSGAQTFHYECPACGPYEIRTVVHQFMDALEFGTEKKAVEMEAAALDRWNKALEVAERHRRLPKRTDDAPKLHVNSSASACA